MRRCAYTEALFLYDYYPVVGSPLEMWMPSMRPMGSDILYFIIQWREDSICEAEEPPCGRMFREERVGKTFRARAGIAFSRGDSLPTSFRENESDAKMGHLWAL